MLQQDPSMRVVESTVDPFLLQWMECEDDDGNPSHKWDAADGGPPATPVQRLL